ncbi:MAG: biotin carboxylase N-terminal domain-containing protein [Alphaproteobacteria bacterium]
MRAPAIKALLVANRGEIACRIFDTAKRLGIRTIAVYSDADAAARHVRRADDAHRLGPAPAGESYLRIDRLLEIAARAGADAVHPGYGFLSENADFAQACEDAGLTFVGPRADVICSMGSKRVAKDVMHQAGVPVVPDYRGTDQSLEAFAAQAAVLGYPVLLKPAHGGGGKGMRRVDRDADLDQALRAAKREAMASFGYDEILAEKYLHNPRHVEVQVFGDTQGNVVHLFERDCTLQRRHQKVIEEAPASFLEPAVRDRLHAAAVRAATAVHYTNAGTVEFLVEPDGTFYFMEMNTRIQVEHPVTEAVTGLDLVEWQLRVAAGEALPLAQSAICAGGYAIEARIYAESPDRGFLPSPGRLYTVVWPHGADVRIDRGIDAGDVVTPHYDPMIAKMTVLGATRDAARRGLLDAILATRIEGSETNLAFLATLLCRPAFKNAATDIHYIDRELPSLVAGADQPASESVAAATLFLTNDRTSEESRAEDPWDDRRGWRLNLPPRRALHISQPGGVQTAFIEDMEAGRYRLIWNGLLAVIDSVETAGHTVSFQLDDRPHTVLVVKTASSVYVVDEGRVDRLMLADPFAPTGTTAASGGVVVAPMPGKVTQVFVRTGQAVLTGDRLAVVEAMKMEHVLRASIDGTVSGVEVGEDQFVDEGDVLVVLEAGDQ